MKTISRDKIIRDSVHGYVTIPEAYINRFVDTEVFQRLRGIEQTGMKCLYPSARHDRFSHSIGTFYIGRMLISAFIGNLKRHNPPCYKAFSRAEWEGTARTFELACLLHDCGHAPFSHLTEKYMFYGGFADQTTPGSPPPINNPAVQGFPFPFNIKPGAVSSHEYASALVVWRRFREDLAELGADPVMALRMILCHEYDPPRDIREIVLNCVFSLLNGMYMDADKLDYIVRDTASSGIDNFSVDLRRLIRAATIVECPDGRPRVGYLKTSVNVIQNIIPAKNNLYLWIYAHHKVQYFSNLLGLCFEKAVGILFGLDTEGERDKILTLCSRIISVEAILERRTVETSARQKIIYLPADDDILALIKEAYNLRPNDHDFIEFFSRVYKKSVWKSYAEFRTLFGFSEKQGEKMTDMIEDDPGRVIDLLRDLFAGSPNRRRKEHWTLFNAKAKLSATKDADIYIQFDHGKAVKYSDISPFENTDLPAFFYLYNQSPALTMKEKGMAVKAIKKAVCL